jgi:hypothetical protein
MTAPGEAEAPPPSRRVPDGRLAGWFALTVSLAAIAYALNFAVESEETDLLYRWDVAVLAVVQYGIILAIVLAISRNVDRATVGFARPPSWPRALGLVVAGWVVTMIGAALLGLVLDAGEEQGLVPDHWDASRAAPFVANFLVVALVAPVVEETTYRGVGYAGMRERFGVAAAVVSTAVLFGAAHGLVLAFPILAAFGLVLGLVRERTRSLYPAMILHGVFNGIVLVSAVTLGSP